MNKILLTLLIVTLLVGTITAITFSLRDSDFTREVTKIDSSKLCEKDSKNLECQSRERKGNYDLTIPDGLEITRNTEGVYRVRAK